MKITDRKKIVFSILKELVENGYIPNNTDYKITLEEFVAVIRFMVNENYLNKDFILFNILGQVEIENEIDTVTDLGLSLIEECEAWNAVYSSINDYENLLKL